jgi:hypothetical protein
VDFNISASRVQREKGGGFPIPIMLKVLVLVLAVVVTIHAKNNYKENLESLGEGVQIKDPAKLSDGKNLYFILIYSYFATPTSKVS